MWSPARVAFPGHIGLPGPSFLPLHGFAAILCDSATASGWRAPPPSPAPRPGPGRISRPLREFLVLGAWGPVLVQVQRHAHVHRRVGWPGCPSCCSSAPSQSWGVTETPQSRDRREKTGVCHDPVSVAVIRSQWASVCRGGGHPLHVRLLKLLLPWLSHQSDDS